MKPIPGTKFCQTLKGGKWWNTGEATQGHPILRKGRPQQEK